VESVMPQKHQHTQSVRNTAFLKNQVAKSILLL